MSQESERLKDALDGLRESEPGTVFDIAARITEAYCIEHNLPCKRRFTHDELQDAFAAVREAHRALYVAPVPAEACSDVGVTS